MGIPSKQAFQNPKLIQLGEAIAANYDQSLFEARADVAARWEAEQTRLEQIRMDALVRELDANSPVKGLTELINEGVSASMMTSEQIRKAAFVEKMRAAKARKAAERAAATQTA